MTDAQSRVTAALEAAKAAAKTESAALNALRQQAEAADDYRQIMNAMGKHVFGYYGQLQEEELEKYWSKRDDIVYAHGSMAYYGRENVYNYVLIGLHQQTTKYMESPKNGTLSMVT